MVQPIWHPTQRATQTARFKQWTSGMNLGLPIELPSYRSRRRSRLAAAHGAHPQGRVLAGIPVVLVEDDRPSAKLMSLLLGMDGAIVSMAHSAEEALPLIEVVRPPVVVLDLVLPRMSGLLLVQQLKAQPWAADIAFVAVTSFNGPEAKRAALQAGCAGYLRKPVDIETFAQFVASHLGGKS
jgi:two-component system cell cycle response regulator DivK